MAESCPPPDMSNFYHLKNISAAGAIILSIVVITLWDQIEKIKNKVLLGSIMAYTSLMFIAMVTCTQAWTGILENNIPKFQNLFYLTQSAFVAAFTCLVFHSAYRTTLILAPRSPHTIKVALFAAFTQMAIHIPAAAYWGLNMAATAGAGISPISQKMEVVVLVYYAVVETSLYLVTQNHIIKVKAAASSGTSTRIKVMLYLKGLLRAGVYSATIILTYLSLGNRLPQPQTMNWQYPMIMPSILLLIILTDSTRFQECIEKLTGTVTYGNSSGKPATNPSIKPQGVRNTASTTDNGV
ncbi:hypothetical protein HDU85_001026 [Gaertneriomyces sp. JEL0708]|nr:hypothetical protein HDU85_001026 [Gaertneriomyces sp. JEL0708]